MQCEFNKLNQTKQNIIFRSGSRISDEGVQRPRGGFVVYFYLNFHKNPHEIEIILSKRGGGSSEPLEPPSGSATDI